MSFGLAIYNSGGTEVFNSDTIDLMHGAAVVDTFYVAAGAAGSQAYLDYAEYTFQVLCVPQFVAGTVQVYTGPIVTVAHDAGYPVISWSASSPWPAGGWIIVLTDTVVSEADFGLLVASSGGQLILGGQFTSYKKLSGVLVGSGTWPGGYAGQITAFPQYQYRFSSSGPIIPLVRPSGGAFGLLGVTQSGSTWDVYAVGAVADVIAFAPQDALPDPTGYGVSLFGTSGEIQWDSSYPPMILRDTASVAVGGSDSLNGGAVPYYLVGTPGWRTYSTGGMSWDLIALWQATSLGGSMYSLSRPETYLFNYSFERGNSAFGHAASPAISLDGGYYS